MRYLGPIETCVNLFFLLQLSYSHDRFFCDLPISAIGKEVPCTATTYWKWVVYKKFHLSKSAKAGVTRSGAQNLRHHDFSKKGSLLRPSRLFPGTRWAFRYVAPGQAGSSRCLDHRPLRFSLVLFFFAPVRCCVFWLIRMFESIESRVHVIHIFWLVPSKYLWGWSFLPGLFHCLVRV